MRKIIGSWNSILKIIPKKNSKEKSKSPQNIVTLLILVYSRAAGGQQQPQIPDQMRQQINQAVGQAVTNAATKELSNVFARKFK